MNNADYALPGDALERKQLHNEVHARPQSEIHIPALVVYVAVLNRDVT